MSVVNNSSSCETPATSTYSGTTPFTSLVSSTIYINGYDIRITKVNNNGSGEGLLYFPYLGKRIPVQWNGNTIVKGEGEYGCITTGIVQAQGSDASILTNDLQRQIAALYNNLNEPGSYSGTFGQAIEAMKTKAQVLLNKISHGDPISPEDYKGYRSICKAIDKGIDEIKNSAQTLNQNPKFLAKIAPILANLDAYKQKILAEADCDGVGYRSKVNEQIFYASLKTSYNDNLVSLCKLGAAQELASNIIGNVDDLVVENAAAQSTIKCGCDGLIDYLRGDRNCQTVIKELERIKLNLKSGKNITYLKGQALGGAGQVQINNVCVDNLQIKFSTDGPFKIDPNSKTKANQGINFSEPNSTNILLSVNVQDWGSLKCEANFPHKPLNYLINNYLRGK